MGVLRQISLFDTETGELISSNQQLAGSRLKGGWIVVYKDALRKLMEACPNYATLRTYLYIATAQDYDTVTYISTSYIAQETGMRYQTVWNSVKWLILEGYVKKVNVKGSTGFIVNPLVTTCGRKKYDEKLSAFIDELTDVMGINAEDISVETTDIPD